MMSSWEVGMGCCLGAAALYLIGRGFGSNAEVLKSVTSVGRLKDLAKLLDIQSNVRPVFVAISGRVSSETAIVCEYGGLRGVIVEEKAEQRYLKRGKDGSWIPGSSLILRTSKEVPWYLDDGTGRAYVTGAKNASGWWSVSTSVSKMFKEPGSSSVPKILGNLQKPETPKENSDATQMLGIQYSSEVLPVGTCLTVVGEAVKDDIGTVRIQRPHTGPFYLSHGSLGQLIGKLEGLSSLCICASIGLSAIGFFIIANCAIQYAWQECKQALQRWRRRQLQRRDLAAAAAAKRLEQEKEDSSAEAEDGSGIAKRDRLVPYLCVICLEHEYDTVFLPCGHMGCCTACSSRLTKCPLCRRRIERVVKTFRP